MSETSEQKKKNGGAAQPTAVLERKLKGHTGWVNSVAVSPDSKWMVSGSGSPASKDYSVKIWDLESGQCRSTFEGHDDQVNCLAITPDGKRILSASDDKSIRVWNTATGRHIKTIKGHYRLVFSVVSLPGGKNALSGANENKIKLWNIDSGKCLEILAGHRSSVRSVAVTWDGKRAVSGSDDKTIKYWDLESGACLTTMTGHAGWIRSVQITTDGRYAVSGSNDKTVKVWDLEKGICIATFEGHKSYIHSIAISPGDSLVASTGFNDNTVRLWDLKTGACVQVIEEKKEYFASLSVAFSPDGTKLVIGNAYSSNDYSLYIYRLSGVEAAVPVEAGERYTNAKVVLVGESGVGKSGLAHRLIEDKFVKTESTHGMQVWQLELPMKKEAGLEREALLWDLAGQEDYRLIHQLFLEETALALVLFNPQKDDPFAEVVDWLKTLDTAVCGPKKSRAKKLLIAARTDVGGIKLSQKKIDEFLKEHGFAGYLATSAMSGENCSDVLNKKKPSALKQLVSSGIPWQDLPWTSTPALLRELKTAVIAMKTGVDKPPLGEDKTTKQKFLEVSEPFSKKVLTRRRQKKEEVSLLRFAELVQRLEQMLPEENFTEEDVRTAVTLLANHGLIWALAFGDLVLLKPELLNSYAGAVIRAARSHTDEIGCVCEQDVFDGKIDFTGVDRLPAADEQLMMRAMVQTFLDKSLCIAEDTPDGKQLVFPSQYRRERPIPAHPDIFVSYTFCGELATVYTTLVVRLWYSREFENKELWRNAAEFTTSKKNITGLILKRSGEGEGTLSVFFDIKVPDELKVVFIKYIHEHLLKYAADVRRDRRYVCANCGTPVIDLGIVRRRLAAQKKFIICQECDEEVKLIDHIEQRLKSDPVARKVFAMDKVAKQELDNQALDQILIGHMLAICGEANQIFRPVTMFDYGIDGEVEFKGEDGNPCGKKIYVQLKSGDSHLRERKKDGKLIFDVKKERHLECWVNQPVDVYLVIRDSENTIRWMNLTYYLKTRTNKKSKQVVFTGEKLDAAAILRLRDRYVGAPSR
ncbi:MAG: DUF4365 domain-containing protein [Candidatus Aminicenantes bacterium]|nr:DUF4365 domain-containing protein [Candidatus Aminicenantes bacterium]